MGFGSNMTVALSRARGLKLRELIALHVEPASRSHERAD